MLNRLGIFAAVVVVGLFTLPVFAQTDVGSVTSEGIVILRPEATALRVQFFVTVQGDDMEKTLLRFKQKGDLIREALTKGDAKSIKLEEPKLVGGLRAVGDFRPHYQQTWMQSQPQNSAPAQICPQSQPQYSPPVPCTPPQKVPGPDQSPAQQVPQQQSEPQQSVPLDEALSELPDDQYARMPRITLQARMTAEWPLESQSSQKALVEANSHVLRAHKELKPFMPVHAFIPPEMIALAQVLSKASLTDSDKSNLNVITMPQYVFVGRLKSEDIWKSKIVAYKKAYAQAKELAEISGSILGPPTAISDSSSASVGGSPAPPVALPYLAPAAAPPSSSYSPYFHMPETTSVLKPGDDVEVTAPDPSCLEYRIHIRAAFRFLEQVPPPTSHSSDPNQPIRM